jgi:hypothetical protein
VDHLGDVLARLTATGSGRSITGRIVDHDTYPDVEQQIASGHATVTGRAVTRRSPGHRSGLHNRASLSNGKLGRSASDNKAPRSLSGTNGEEAD